MMRNKRKKKNDSFWPFCHCSKNGHDMVATFLISVCLFCQGQHANVNI